MTQNKEDLGPRFSVGRVHHDEQKVSTAPVHKTLVLVIMRQDHRYKDHWLSQCHCIWRAATIQQRNVQAERMEEKAYHKLEMHAAYPGSSAKLKRDHGGAEGLSLSYLRKLG